MVVECMWPYRAGGRLGEDEQKRRQCIGFFGIFWLLREHLWFII